MVWVSEERSGELVPRSLQEFGAVPRGGGWNHINEGGGGGGGGVTTSMGWRELGLKPAVLCTAEKAVQGEDC